LSDIHFINTPIAELYLDPREPIDEAKDIPLYAQHEYFGKRFLAFQLLVFPPRVGPLLPDPILRRAD